MYMFMLMLVILVLILFSDYFPVVRFVQVAVAGVVIAAAPATTAQRVKLVGKMVQAVRISAEKKKKVLNSQKKLLQFQPSYRPILTWD